MLTIRIMLDTVVMTTTRCCLQAINQNQQTLRFSFPNPCFNYGLERRFPFLIYSKIVNVQTLNQIIQVFFGVGLYYLNIKL